MPIQRAADPLSVQNVWNAIRVANAQKQMADLARITKYLQKELSCSQGQSELYLKQTLQDGLVVAVHKISGKGAKAGNEVESYKIPMQEQENTLRAGHDWYCIDCHLAGDVILCATCHRVFHAECAHKKQCLFRNIPENKKASNDSSLLESDKLGVSCSTVKNPELISNKQNESSINSTLELSLENGHQTDNDPISDLNHSEQQNNHHSGVFSSKMDDESYYDEAVCSICNISRIEPELTVEQDELNYLLTFIHNRIKSWVPADLTKCLEPDETPPPEWYTNKERTWRAEKLFYENTNMITIEKKLQAKEYRQPYEYKADILTVQHNVAIYHGTETQEYAATEFLVKDGWYEISELSNCIDCYKHSNEKVNEHWFCIPCRTPHRLVWAKQQGYPYWPAKVLKENDRSCDVRFFGSKNERAILSKAYIKPITVNKDSLNIKKNPAFNKAFKELIMHQKLLKNTPTSNVENKKVEEIQESKKDMKERSSHKRKSAKLAYKSSKTQKRSHSVDLLSAAVNTSKKTTKRRNSSATVNNLAKLRGNDHTTRQTIHNMNSANKANSSAPIIQNAKDMNLAKLHNEDAENLMQSPEISLEESNIEDKNDSEPRIEESNEIVTSSSETVQIPEEICNFPDIDTKMPKPERQYSESVEKTRRKLEQCVGQDELIKVSLECMQAEIDKITNEHDTYLKKIFEAHNNQISETKKKQWCYNCEQDAIYHCCWNTAYCSLICQQQHWQSEHKKVCRRKR